jgi:effector-binding domain-containing protein
VRDLLPIGRFSKVTRITVKALRHYDDLGLLRPAVVDPDSGYRYYSMAQALEAERIRLLRSLDMPLDDVRRVLSAQDPAEARRLLDGHEARMRERLTVIEEGLRLLHKLRNGKEGIMAYEVKVREVVPQPVLSVRTRTSLAQIADLMGAAFGEMFGYLFQAGAQPAGPPCSIYHDPEFREDDLDVEICVPVDRPLPPQGRVQMSELPGGTVAYTLHVGPYDGVGPAYQAVTTWIQEHGHETAGPPRETYLNGPDEVKDPSEYRTEIIWPIR